MMVTTCSRCGASLASDARFCSACGAPVPAEGGEERKVVTVLFADLAGSTELAAALDPERVREVMGAFYRMASDEVASLRGRTEKFVGDAVMSVFGLPHAHDDDALRAVRAGLSIRDRVARVGESLGLPQPLRVRVGINTGPVATTSAPGDEFLVSGASVNLAARLQQAAHPDEVVVGDLTWQLTRYAAEFGPGRPVSARGFDGEVSAFPVVALSPRSARRTIPLIGRRRELVLLTEAVHRTRETSHPHLVTITGETGIGKSRLVEELLASLPDEVEVLFGRASEFGENAALAPLADMVRRRLGVEADAAPPVIRRRLEEVVAGCCDPADADQVAARLGLLLGLGEERAPGSPYRIAEIRGGLSGFVAGLAGSGLVVMVVEDLHVARPSLLDLLEELVRASRKLPLALVAVARDELLRSRPSWGAGVADALVVRLEPLGPDEARDLAVAAGESLDQATARRVTGHAGGNPFFIVETTGMLLHERGEEPHGIPRVDHLLAPTVQAVVASRIDHLPDRARALLRVASVLPGTVFHESRLRILTEADPEVLRTLEEEELLMPEPERPGRWRFRHELLREVAYESLAKRDRRRLHERVAEALGSGEEADRHAREIAHHLEEAARAALDLDPADREPAIRAVEALRRAGDLARWRTESRAALDLYERALDLSGPKQGWGREQARILANMGESHYWLGRYEDAEGVIGRALEIAPDDAWTRALGQRFLADIVLNIRGDPDRARELFEDSLEAARELGNPWALARTLLMAGWVPYWVGDLEGARAMFEEALAIARDNAGSDPWAEARALNSLVSVVSPISDVREALELAERALALGREMGDPFTTAGAQENRAGGLRRLWRLDDALACADEAVRIYRELGARWEVAAAQGDRGHIHRLAGRLQPAEDDLREALALCLDLRDQALVVWTACELATTLVVRGDLEGARAVLDEPALASDGEEAGSRASVLLTRALIALAEGRADEGRRLAREGLEMERRRALPNWLASATWWVGRLFGAGAVGGPEALEEARRHLEEVGWVSAVREPDLVKR